MAEERVLKKADAINLIGAEAEDGASDEMLCGMILMAGPAWAMDCKLAAEKILGRELDISPIMDGPMRGEK